MAKQKRKKVEIKSKLIRGKAVMAAIDGMPVAEVDKLQTSAKKNKKVVYLTGDLTADNPAKTIRVHRSEDDAVSRFSRRFPVITKGLRKRL